MVTAPAEPPLLVSVGSPEHAVNRCAATIAHRVSARADWQAGLHVRSLQHVDDAHLASLLAGNDAVHVHFTDKLFGANPDEAGGAFARIAAVLPVSVTLHDLPQPSDGHAFARRIDAYRRVVRAASGVVCNSRYERALLAEHTVAGEPSGERGAQIAPKIDQYREGGAELDHRRESGEGLRRLVPSEQERRETEVGVAADRQELRQTLNDAVDDGA